MTISIELDPREVESVKKIADDSGVKLIQVDENPFASDKLLFDVKGFGAKIDTFFNAFENRNN
jgi:hypothetical protein